MGGRRSLLDFALEPDFNDQELLGCVSFLTHTRLEPPANSVQSLLCPAGGAVGISFRRIQTAPLFTWNLEVFQQQRVLFLHNRAQTKSKSV